jgi:cytoskeletal protein RodZ
MALSTDDVAAITKLLDERLAAHQQVVEQSRVAADRARIQDDLRRGDRRRAFWRALFIVFLIAIGICGWVVVKVYTAIHAQVVASEDAVQKLQQQLSEAKVAYQQELAQNKQWQKDREAAVANTHYDSTQNQASFDANLVAKTFALLNQAQQVRAKAKTATGDDEADIDAQLQGVTDVSDNMTNILMQLMLHETDPAHDSPAESAAINDSHQHAKPGAQATPLQAAPSGAQSPPAPVTQTPPAVSQPAPVEKQPAPTPAGPQATPLNP